MIGLLCGVIGIFIVFRWLALMVDALPHSVLPGVALPYMLPFSYYYDALFTRVLTALVLGIISQNSRVKNDSSIGIVFSAMLALGIILITTAQSATDLTQILFGNVLAVRSTDMMITLIVGAVILLAVFLFYKELLVSSFD